MKLNAKNNPHGVAVGQVWRSRDKRRQRKFVIVGVSDYYADVQYNSKLNAGCVKRKYLISLLRFDRYQKIK